LGINQRSQITMSDEEVAAFIDQSRVATMGTIGPDGRPHLVAMWYGVIDGAIWFATKAKSQKLQNLLRDNRITCSIEDGDTYDTLRGVSIDGTAELTEDPELMFKAGVSIYNRYNAPFTERDRPNVETMLHKRVAIRIDAQRIRSWDHKKLGLPAAPVAGTTARYIGQHR